MSTLANSRLRPYAGRRPPPRATRAPATAPARIEGETLRARDGSELLLRPIHADDAAALQRGFRHLTAEEVRLRFLHPLTDLPESLARDLCDVNPNTGVAFVLIDPLPAPEPEIHAVARAYIDPTTLAAEFAIVVQHRYAGQGFGKLLMQRVVAACRALGATELWGDVFLENSAMLALCRNLGCAQRSLEHEPGVVRVTLTLA